MQHDEVHENASVISFDLSRCTKKGACEHQVAVIWLRNFFENSSVAVAYFDEMLHCRYINQALSRFISMPKKVAEMKSLWGILPGLAPIIDQRLHTVLETNLPMPQREMIVIGSHSDSVPRYILANAQPVHLFGRDAAGVLVQFIDITHRKCAEHRLTSLNILLNDRLMQTTSELKSVLSQKVLERGTKKSS